MVAFTADHLVVCVTTVPLGFASYTDEVLLIVPMWMSGVRRLPTSVYRTVVRRMYEGMRKLFWNALD